MKYYKAKLDRYGEEGEDTQVVCVSPDKMIATIYGKVYAYGRGGKYEVTVDEFELRADNLKEIYLLTVKNKAKKGVPLDHIDVLSFQYQHHSDAWAALENGKIPMREIIELKPFRVDLTMSHSVAIEHFNTRIFVTDEEREYIKKTFPGIENEKYEE